MSVVAVCATTKMYDTEQKEMFYAKHVSVLDHFPIYNTLIVLGDFNAGTVIERAGNKIYVGPHGSITSNHYHNYTRI